MPYIPVSHELPGIIGLLETYTETGSILKNLANTLLNKDTEAFSKSERETVASYISYLNKCHFCYKSHSAIADCLWKQTDKLTYILYVAKKLHNSVQGISQDDISLLYTNYHFTSEDVNDLILIISSFCMFNRYVDGLGTNHSQDNDTYIIMGKKIAEHGYI
jgi:alkylhydroperoxidase family enzyme